MAEFRDTAPLMTIIRHATTMTKSFSLQIGNKMSSVNKDLPTRKCQVADLEEAVENMRRLTMEKLRTGFLGKEFLIYPEVFHPDPWHEIIA